MYKIEKVGMPPARKTNAKYPYDLMQVGDSFFVPGKRTAQLAGPTHSAAQRRGWKLVSRFEAVDGVTGVRVYRVK
jgi:hypothetical protein